MRSMRSGPASAMEIDTRLLSMYYQAKDCYEDANYLYSIHEKDVLRSPNHMMMATLSCEIALKELYILENLSYVDWASNRLPDCMAVGNHALLQLFISLKDDTQSEIEESMSKYESLNKIDVFMPYGDQKSFRDIIQKHCICK